MTPSPGAVAANFHEGSRSEYLAQYVFSMFGTAALVPHQEDYGLDLICTLTERKGGRAEPYAYYSVQVKSADDPWEFGSAASVQWILRYPAPLLLCVVDKKAARFRIYQLTARFQAALLTELPEYLSLIPGKPGSSADDRPSIGWDAKGQAKLGPPIVEFTVTELLDDDTFEIIRRVLDFWVTNDLRNIRRQEMSMRVASGPPDYTTNKVPPTSGFGKFSMTVVPPAVQEAAGRTAAEHLDWLGQVMLTSGDRTGALLAALMVRHLIPDGDPARQLGFSPTTLYADLGGIARQIFTDLDNEGSLVTPIDAILSELDRRIRIDD